MEKLFENKRTVVIGSIVFIGAIIFYFIQACSPQKGNIIYGLCNVFLEQQLTFPSTLEQTYVEQFVGAVRIYYKHMDGYGQQEFSFIECTFNNDPEKGIQLQEVLFKSPVKEITEKYYDKEKKRTNYRVKQDMIDLFNNSQSPAVIMSQDPDLTLPHAKAMF